MRLITNGFEFASVAGNFITALDPEITIETSIPRQTSLGNGGSRYLQIDSLAGETEATFQTLDYDQIENYFKCSQRIQSTSPVLEYIFSDDTTEVFKIRSVNSGPFSLWVGGVQVATGSFNLTEFVWQDIEIYADIDATGTITVTVDGLLDINYSGNTTTGSTSWNNYSINAEGFVLFDDLIINNTYTVLKYNGGNGVIPTGTVSSIVSSASIIHHVGDGTKGFMVIDNAGTAFTDGIALSATGFSGTSFGDEEVGNITEPSVSSYIQIFKPNANGTYSNLAGSDGNSTDNYLLVDDNEDISDVLSTSTPGDFDTYSYENLPADATDVNYIESCFYSKRDGSAISNQRSHSRIGGTDYESHIQAITSNYVWNKFPYQVNPDSDTDWTISDVNNLEIGPGGES